MQSKIEATKTADQPASFGADLWKMKRRTWNPVKDLMWNLLQKIINDWNSLTIFARNSIWRPATLLKRDSGTGVSCEFCKISKNTFLQNTSWRLLLHVSMHWGVCKSHCRSSRPKMFYKKGVLKNFAKFTRKDVCRASFLMIKMK